LYSLPQPFSDPGTNLAYYNYTAQGAVTAITTDTADCTGTSVPSRCGYILNCNGQTGDIASATTSYFTPNQITQRGEHLQPRIGCSAAWDDGPHHRIL